MSVVVSLVGGLAVFLAPTIRWPLAAAISFFLLAMVSTAAFLLWRTEVVKASQAYENLRPRFRIVPMVVKSKDRVRAVVEVVNESRARIHNLRVAVVDVDRPSREPAGEEFVGQIGPLPQEGPVRYEGPRQRESVTLDGRARFDLAMALAHGEGIYQSARDLRERGGLLPEGETYVFRVEAAADDVPRLEALLELRTTSGGPGRTDADSGKPIPREPMPSFEFGIA